jgi:transcriptional regulator with XRE-family HTH domain
MDEAELYKRFGQLVRRHRDRLNLSQAQIADAVGLTRASVANIETGRQRIPLHQLFRLARAFQVEVDALLPRQTTATQTLVDHDIRSSMNLTDREQDEIVRVVNSIRDPTPPRRTK